MLLAAADEGLGALFFGIPPALIGQFLRLYGVPDSYLPIGAVAIGYPDPAADKGGSSRVIKRRSLDDLVHRGRCSQRRNQERRQLPPGGSVVSRMTTARIARQAMAAAVFRHTLRPTAKPARQSAVASQPSQECGEIPQPRRLGPNHAFFVTLVRTAADPRFPNSGQFQITLIGHQGQRAAIRRAVAESRGTR